jgi:hypothetical protein
VCPDITTDQARSRSGPATGPTTTPQGRGHRPFGAPCSAPWPRARATPTRRSPPAGVARYILSVERSLEPPDVSVGVTRQMRQHVRNRPPGQPARRANLLVGDVLHPRDQPRVCGPAQLDRRGGISVQITRHSPQPPTRRHVCAVSHSVCQLGALVSGQKTDRTLRGAAGPRRVGGKSSQPSGTPIVLNLDPFYHDRPLPTAALNGRYGWRSANRHLRRSVTDWCPIAATDRFRAGCDYLKFLRSGAQIGQFCSLG